MATLSDLRTQIKLDTRVNGTEKDSQIDNAIRSALRQLRGKKYWFLRQETTATLASGDSSIALSSEIPDLSVVDDVQLIDGTSVLYDGGGFDFLAFSNFKRKWYTQATKPSGKPLACAVLNGVLTFSHTADQNYTVLVDYYQKDESLPTDDTDTSVWFEEGYDVVRALAMDIFQREVQGNAEYQSVYAYYLQQLSQTGMSYEIGGR